MSIVISCCCCCRRRRCHHHHHHLLQGLCLTACSIPIKISFDHSISLLRFHSPCGPLTPCSRVLLEKLIFIQLLKKFPAFYGNQRFITMFTRVHQWSLFWARWNYSRPSHPISLRAILILPTHLCPDLPNGVYSSHFWSICIHLSFFPCMPHDHLSYPPWFDDPIYIWWSKQVMMFLTVHFSSASHHVLPLRSIYPLLRTQFSNTLNLCSSLSVRNQVSKQYKAIGKTVILYILIFKFFERR